MEEFASRDVVARIRRWRPTTRHVWILFVAVHVWIALLGVWLVPGRVYWDLTLYRSWMWWGANLGDWPVLTQPWVYPAGALIPLILVNGLAGYNDTSFAIGWTVMVAILNAAAVQGLLRRPGGRLAATWWMVFLGAIGAVGIGRLDALVPPIAVLGLLAAEKRPRLAAALLTIGAWIKVAPGALMLPVVLAIRRRWQDGIAPAAAVSAAVVGLVGVLGGMGYITSFLFTQGGRGLQVEAVGASPWLVWGLFSSDVTRDYNQDIITFEVHGPGVATAVTVLDLSFLVAALIVTALLFRRRIDGPRPLPAPELISRGALMVLLTMIVTNKVLSPQYIVWLAAPVAVAVAWQLPGWRRTGLSLLGIAAATQIIFPWFYDYMLAGDPAATIVLAARNIALVVLWASAGIQIVKAPSERDQTADVVLLKQ